MSFGFSVGDFLAVGALIVKIVDTLRGTQSEYQELIRELESLNRALTQVDKLKGRGDQAIAIDQIKCAALTCKYPLEEFLAKIQKYEKSLGLGKSVGKIKDASRKFQYAFGKKDEANTLRNYLNMHIGIINMLLIRQGLEMLDVASEQTDKNQEELRDSIEGSCRELREVRGSVDAQALAVKENNSIIQKLFGMVSGEIAAPLKSLSQTVAKVCVSTQQIYTIVLEIRASLLGIDTRFTYFQAPVRVEDVVGRVFPFPSECSIEALNAEIKARFKEGPGKTEVMAGDFEIFNAKNTDQVLTISGRDVLLPGMSINMAIVLEQEFAEGDKCPMPRCASKTFVEAVGGGRTCSECNIWFDGASKKRKRDFEGEQISKHVKTLADRNRHKAKRPKTLPADLQEVSDLSSDEDIAAIEHSDPKETSISAFKRIRFDTGLQALAIEELVKFIDLKRDQIPYSDVELRGLFRQMRPMRRKWASDSRIGQEELYEATEVVLNGLKAIPEHSKPFLRPVNKREAPDYYQVIKRPMDLHTMTKKLKTFQYNSKGEIVDDLDLIWTNCLRYFDHPTHPLCKDACWMRKDADKLIPLIPDIVIEPMSIKEADRAKVTNYETNSFTSTAFLRSQHPENNNIKSIYENWHGNFSKLLQPNPSENINTEFSPKASHGIFAEPPPANSRTSSMHHSEDGLFPRSLPLVLNEEGEDSRSKLDAVPVLPNVNTIKKKQQQRITLEEATHECRVCGKLFKRSDKWKSHIKTHNPEHKYPHFCTAMVDNTPCARKFQQKTDLDQHYDIVHLKPRNHRCNLCSNHFARRDTLRRHSEEKCPKRFELGLREGSAVAFPEKSPTPERLSMSSNLSSKGTNRHPKAQASQGDAVLIALMGGLNHPDLATKVGEVLLPESDDSDVYDPIDVDGRKQTDGNKPVYDKNVDLIHLAENALLLKPKSA